MARNGSGVFAVLNPIQIGALRSSAAVNQDFSDAGAEITNTLPRSGVAAMTGQFKAAPGTLGVPGIAYGAEISTGFRVRGLNQMAMVSGGIERLYNDASGMQCPLNFVCQQGVNVAGVFGGAGVLDLAALEAVGGNGLARRVGTNTWILDDGTHEINFIKDHSRIQIPAGVLGDLRVQFACQIIDVALMANAAGSFVLDIWKAPFANYPPTAGNSITGGNKPTLAGTDKQELLGVAILGWSTLINAGDCLRFNVDSTSSAITRVDLVLKVKRFT